VSGEVHLETAGPVGWVVFDNPERRNALTPEAASLATSACYQSEDFRERQRAFAEKRRPDFKGR
jgi:enoyl-CoA hydratase/carnithine racemase